MTQIVVPATATTPGYAVNEEHRPDVKIHNHVPYQTHGMEAKDAVFTSAVDMSRQIGHAETGVTGAVNHSAHDLSRQLGGVESGLLSAVFKNTYDLSVAVEKIGAANSLAIEKTAAATNLQIVTKAQEAQLLAVQTAAAAAKQLADCCCEIKELTKDEAGKTRDLINALNLKNVQDQLADAKLKIAIAERRPLIPGI